MKKYTVTFYSFDTDEDIARIHLVATSKKFAEERALEIAYDEDYAEEIERWMVTDFKNESSN